MKTENLILVLIVIGGALYLLSRNRENQMLPPERLDALNRASTAGGATGIGTNPITLAFSTIEKGLTSLLGSARAGNAPGIGGLPASPPTAGPTVYAGTLPASPPLAPLPVGGTYAPIQDPSQGFLTSLDDFATMFGSGGVTVPDVSSANQAGQLSVSPDFNWEYSPTTPSVGVR